MKAGSEVLHEKGKVMEEKVPAPQFQRFLFPEREEPSDVPAGNSPVDFGDPLSQSRLYPTRIDLDFSAGPGALLVERTAQQLEVWNGLFVDIPDEIVPVPTLHVCSIEHRADLHGEAGFEALSRDGRRYGKGVGRS